jgi:pimeloyl-ACP methyl ester carboxylesterase
VRLPHDDVGSGPAIVLLHAGVADRTMWAEHLQPLADAGHRVVAMDLPGFGEAPEPPLLAPWADVVETMDSLGLERATLVGNSFGAAVALRVAAVAPERVAALVLVSPPPREWEPSERLQAAWDAEEAALEREDVEGAVTAVVDAWTLPDAPAELRDRVAAMQRRALETQMAGGEPEEAPDPLEGRELQVPALIGVGEQDMPDFHAAADAWAAELPDAGRVTIAGAGHLAPLEQPEAFRELLVRFLREAPH